MYYAKFTTEKGCAHGGEGNDPSATLPMQYEPERGAYPDDWQHDSEGP